MAITRRQFVTRLGALAAVVGFSQADVSKLSEAFAGNSTNLGGTAGKPRVIWIHGAECTGCSVSLLSILENPNGHALYGSAVTTGAALGLAGVTATAHPFDPASPFTLWNASQSMVEGRPLVDIADVVIDVVDLQYHETIMGMGGDLAAKWLNDFAGYTPNYPAGTHAGDAPFVLVVEGALQDKADGGAWSDTSDTSVPWCSIGVEDGGNGEIEMSAAVVALAKKVTCIAVIGIGQCASYGGYPGCKPPISSLTAAGFDPTKSQTGARGVSKFLLDSTDPLANAAAAKVVNVPGCPPNPWWFVLTVVLFMADYLTGAIGILGPQVAGTPIKPPLGSAVDAGGRLKAVYPIPVHSPYCPRYRYYATGVFALKPGDQGCLKNIGCKGIATSSSCGIHGWNNQQLENGTYSLTGVGAGKDGTYFAGHCTKSGHPCMACTEKGYPDAFVPYVKL
jgi:Ni,Fe-hydrogenase I small subunit